MHRLAAVLALFLSFASAFVPRNNNMPSSLLQAASICPELPLTPQTPGNEVTVVACG